MTTFGTGSISVQQLRQFIEKIERLEEEKTQLSEHVRDTFSEAKAHGFDVKTIRQIIKIRKMKPEDRTEQEELLDLYCHALGMLPNAHPSPDIKEVA